MMGTATGFVRTPLPPTLRGLHAGPRLILVLLVVAFACPSLRHANDVVAARFAGSTDTTDWKAAAFWLESAECVRRIGLVFTAFFVVRGIRARFGMLPVGQ